jgi:hypothetical protein
MVVGLIMLVLITLIVTTAFTLSTTNLKSVGNMQLRDEAIAAANVAVEQIVGVDFVLTPTAVPQPVYVDIRTGEISNVDPNDRSVYLVTFPTAPVCVRASLATKTSRSSVTLPTTLSSSSQWNTVWDFDALSTNTASGASVHVRQGVRVLLSGSSSPHLNARTVCGIT